MEQGTLYICGEMRTETAKFGLKSDPFCAHKRPVGSVARSDPLCGFRKFIPVDQEKNPAGAQPPNGSDGRPVGPIQFSDVYPVDREKDFFSATRCLVGNAKMGAKGRSDQNADSTAEKSSVHRCQNLAVLDRTFDSIYLGVSFWNVGFSSTSLTGNRSPLFINLPLTRTDHNLFEISASSALALQPWVSLPLLGFEFSASSVYPMAMRIRTYAFRMPLARVPSPSPVNIL